MRNFLMDGWCLAMAIIIRPVHGHTSIVHAPRPCKDCKGARA